VSQIAIRKATTADAELLSELGARTFSETFAVDNTPEDMTAYLQDSFNPAKQLAELSDPNTIVKFAELNGVTVGYSVLSSTRTPAEISSENAVELVRLYVSQNSIGTGVGARLMKDCLDEARQLNFETIWLGVWEHNQRAQTFYRKWNFEVFGTHVFQLGDDAQTDLLMKRSIQQQPVGGRQEQ
jgi:ribosomal protein S18 acetylase RimI-like enzyme